MRFVFWTPQISCATLTHMSWFDQRPDDAMMGSFEAVGHEHIATVEPAQFREAMSQLGAAVHVVTTAGPAGRAGFTATAVCSVSDQPATLLVCVNRRSQATPILDTNRVLCVNTRASQASVRRLVAFAAVSTANASA